MSSDTALASCKEWHALLAHMPRSWACLKLMCRASDARMRSGEISLYLALTLGPVSFGSANILGQLFNLDTFCHWG